MVEELEPELEIGIIKLIPGETFYYTAWGIRYRFKGGSWRIADIVFGKKSDAEDWANEHFNIEGIEAEIVPVKRCLLLDVKGHTKAWTEELT